MEYRDFIDQFSNLTEKERHYQYLFEEGMLPSRPEDVHEEGHGVTLGENLLEEGRDVVVQKHTCFLPVYPHDHEFLEIEVVAKGSCSQDIYGSHVVMHEGDALLIAPHTYHAIGVFSEDTVVLNVMVRLESTSDSLAFAPKEGELGKLFDILRAQSGAQGCVLVHGCQEAFSLLPELATGKGTFARLRLAEFFFLLGKGKAESLVESDEKSLRLALVLERIRESGGSVSQKELAGEVGVTPAYLSYLVHQETGMTFSRIACRERVALSCKLLRSGLSCKEVARRLHMNPERFSRFFRQATGVTPGKWKMS